MNEAARDRQVAIETVRPRAECHHCNPGLPAPAAGEIDRHGAYEDALRNIAAAAVTARRTHRLDELLVTVESQLSALIAVGYIPGPPDPSRRPLTAPVQP